MSENITNSQRISWVDNAKFIGIFFVIMDHLEFTSGLERNFFLPFYLCVFYFCAGYVYRYEESFKVFFLKKVRGLFVPWFVFGFFNIILKYIVSFNEQPAIKEQILQNILQAEGWYQQLWFLAALFAAFIPFYFLEKGVQKLNKKYKYTYELCILVGPIVIVLYYYLMQLIQRYISPPWCNLWHINIWAQICYPMLVGRIYREKYEKCLQCLDIKKRNIYGFLLILIYFFADSTINKAMWLNPAQSLLYQNVLSALGVGCLVFICKRLNDNGFIQYCGRNTIIIFAFQGKAISVIQSLMRAVLGVTYNDMLNNMLLSSAMAFLLAGVVLVMMLIPIWIINRYCPFLIGRTNGKR